MLKRFTQAYIDTALWSSPYGDDGECHLDDGVHELADETEEKMQADCKAFYEANTELIGYEVEQAGCDFWLTRCGHGAGFWDGDWPEPQATKLTEASHGFGNVDLYVGDDGLIYSS